MKIINLYLVKNLTISFITAITIATFVMLLGQLTKVFDLLTQGVDPKIILMYVGYRMPQALGYTIPLGFFISTVLILNRMSLDNEISALRASGVSIQQIIAPIVLLSLGLCILCGFIHLNISPEYQYRAKWLVREAGIINPLMLIEEGRYVEIFDGYIVYVDKKQDTSVRDVHLYILNKKDVVVQKIDAYRGEIIVENKRKEIQLTLFNATIESIHPEDISKNQRIKSGKCMFPLSYGNKLHKKPLIRRVDEMKISQLFSRIQIQSERGIDTTKLYVELHLRAAMALSPFSFILLGIPLGIRLPRRETSWSLYGCILIPLIYFVSVSIIEGLYHFPQYKPEFLLWIPNIVCQISGIWALWIKK